MGIWVRVVAHLRREVSVEKLEAYREAGSSVYDLLDRVQQQRDEVKVAGRSPWDADRGLQFQVAFAWNAFVLQTLGDEFVEAGHTVAGFLPRVTSEQAMAFYGQVESWISRANQAASNPAYVPNVHLAAHLLPLWVDVIPCPHTHLAAMLAAVKSIQGRAELAVGAFGPGEVPVEHERLFGQVRQRIADADTATEYAWRLSEGDPVRQLHAQIERHIKDALEGYYLAGQMLAMPELVRPANQPAPRDVPRSRPRRRRSRKPGHDRTGRPP